LQNYPEGYKVFVIKDLTREKLDLIWGWVEEKSGGTFFSWLLKGKPYVRYDFWQAIGQYLRGRQPWLAKMLGFSEDFNQWDSPIALQSAEFIIRALGQAGYVVEHPPGYHLYSHIVQSGHLQPV
jgi:hypothetical protein